MIVHIDPILPGDDLSAEKAAALNSFAETSMELTATMHAAQISLDRMGGAFEADDEYWTIWKRMDSPLRQSKRHTLWG